MPTNVTGVGDSWNLPNYAGELFTASPTKTPFLSLIGGLSGGASTHSSEFIIDQEYDFPAAAQPAISETASLTAPTPTELVRGQNTNVVQIFQETISLSYAKMGDYGHLAGLNLGGVNANPTDELSWQIARRLEKIARDVEYTFLNGTYQRATAANVANKTRGILSVCANGTNVDANGAAISMALLKQAYKAMADAGAAFGNMMMFVGSKQKQAITTLYESQLGYNAPRPDNKGGMNIVRLENDFFEMGIVYDPFMPSDAVLIADISACKPVFKEVPGKGVLFLEDLAKTGASETKQIYGEIGLAYGASFLHASITDLG